MKQCDSLTVKNASLKSVCYVTESAVCSLVSYVVKEWVSTFSYSYHKKVKVKVKFTP